MEPILDEINATINCGIWYPAVLSTLMLPDVCGAIEYAETAVKPSDRYKNWYDRWVMPHYESDILLPDGTTGPLNGAFMYLIRNSMVHESSSFIRGKISYDRVLFMPPLSSNSTDRDTITYIVGGGDNSVESKVTAYTMSIVSVFKAMEAGVNDWLMGVREDQDDRRRIAMDGIIQLRPEGVRPFIGGIPVVC